MAGSSETSAVPAPESTEAIAAKPAKNTRQHVEVDDKIDDADSVFEEAA